MERKNDSAADAIDAVVAAARLGRSIDCLFEGNNSTLGVVVVVVVPTSFSLSLAYSSSLTANRGENLGMLLLDPPRRTW